VGTATVLTTCVLKGWALVFVPYAAIGRFSREAIIGAGVGLAGVCLASVAFYLAQPGMEDCPTDGPRWWRQAVASAVGSVVAVIALFV
jgi:phytol kinase